MSYRPILEIIRGNTVESLHFGAIAVSDIDGNLLASWGSTDNPVFLRSAAKPFQAFPFLETGAAAAYDLTAKQIALICSSHAGTDMHVEVVRSIQDATGVNEQDLQCGVHSPLDKATAERLLREVEKLTSNRHNCSGKHTGMLALCRFLDLPTENYLAPEHPVQKMILERVRDFFDLEVKQIVLAVDGCSAPIFAVSLKASSKAYARLADPGRYSESRKKACRDIWEAMTGFPIMVAGENRFDTNLMEIGKGKILAKGGAEGFQAVAIAPDAWGKGNSAIGIAIKVSDGDLEIMPKDLLDQLSERINHKVTSWQKIEVGEIRPSFTLQ
jgi:L-asparaginase II